jgi:hypothetical protein
VHQAQQRFVHTTVGEKGIGTALSLFSSCVLAELLTLEGIPASAAADVYRYGM